MKLRDLPHWVAWREEMRDGKETKVPVSPHEAKRARTDDPATWGSLTEARKAEYERDYSGVGFVFTAEDPFCGVDLDGVLDSETGEVEGWAMTIVKELDSYTEYSPSGTGIHVIVRAALPRGGNRKDRVEMYDRGRFFTVTGRHMPGTPKSVEDRQPQIDALHRRLFPPRAEPSRNGHAYAVSDSIADEELLERARSAANGEKFDLLWSGDWESAGYGSHSEADMALCSMLAFWTGPDVARIADLFSRSGIIREKWNREDYRQRTIDRALKKAEFYRSQDAGRSERKKSGGDRSSRVSAAPPPEASPGAEDRGGKAGGAKARGWPVLVDDAFQGLPGHLVRAIEPHTEADPVAVLVSLLSAFGNACGRGAYFRVGADRHHPKINAALVGETSKGRKGMSWGFVRDLIHSVDHYWAEERVENGLSSGEGLIYQVRDKRMGVNKDGDTVIEDPGAEDKRLFVLEGEFAGVLKVATREGNTLSAIIRSAWDAGKLSTLTKNSPMKATDSHVSIVGHVTATELVRLLSESDAHNGFANRFLWLCVKRSNVLPFGGQWENQDVAGMASLLGEVLRFAKAVGEMRWGESAKPLWVERYPSLSEGTPGLVGAVTSRSEAQVLRLACVYALMDSSAAIELEHLKAALAVWDYAEASARYIFGDATGDAIADRIEGMLSRAVEGMTRAQIRDTFGRNISSGRIGAALELLERHRRIRKEIEQTGGRPAERWLIG